MQILHNHHMGDETTHGKTDEMHLFDAEMVKQADSIISNYFD